MIDYSEMPNGSEMLSIYTDNDVETYRDVLYYVGQVLGGFFCINREGKLELRKFGLKETREQLCMNILYDLSVVDYVPFDSDTIGKPALDLGDVIKFRGGQADGTKISAITSMQCKIGGKHNLISQYENNVVASSIDKLQDLARHLETTVGYLVDGIEMVISEEETGANIT